MIFGNPQSFAVEAIVEPGPEFPATFGANVFGRMRLLVGGTAVGDIDEQSCVPRSLSEHLIEICERASELWHPVLSGLPPEQLFRLLDDALFLGGGRAELEECHETVFLMNVSEAFDSVKGFVLFPASDEFLLLLQLDAQGTFISRRVAYAEVESVAKAFAQWVLEQERRLLHGSTV